jgi:two-component system, LuxR family, sensor kinase FixL
VARPAFKRLLDRSRHRHREPLGGGELIALSAGGAEIPVEISIAPIERVGERFFTLYIHDISSRKHAEQEIKSLARFAGESPHPILRVTAAGLIVYANNASRPLLRAWGAEPGEPLPEDWGAAVTAALETAQPLNANSRSVDRSTRCCWRPFAILGMSISMRVTSPPCAAPNRSRASIRPSWSMSVG